MHYHIPKDVIHFMKQFIDHSYQIYIVGGAVRDLMLKRSHYDWDFTTDAKPDQILKLFPEGFYDNSFGTVGIPIKQSLDTSQPSIFEVTTMRKEGVYQDSRHPSEVGWTQNLEEDLKRRDFTVNAMALSIDGVVTDLFDGQQDLQKKIIRSVGNPQDRFSEDALRMLKAFRMVSQLGFDIEQKTFEALISQRFLIQQIAWERIRDELFKLLSGEDAYKGLVLMRKAGVLQIILPEVEECFGIVQEGPKHDRVYDIGEHSFLTMKFTPTQDPLVKFAALLHDIGKVKTMKVQSDGNVTFYNHDVVGAQQSLHIAKRFHLSKKQTDKLYNLVRWHLFTVDEHQTDSAIRRFIKNVGLENVEDMMNVREGDRLGGGTSTPTSWGLERFKTRIQEVLTKPFSITDLKVNGQDVMEVLQIPPSRKVGEILDTLFQEVLEDSSKNTREYLMQRIKSLVA